MLRLSCKFLPNEPRQRVCLSRRQVALLVLCVEVEHIERLACRIPIVDQTQAAPFSPPLREPAQLPQSVPAWDNRALLGAKGECQLECAICVIVEMAPKRCGKDRSLDKAHAGSYANGVAVRKRLLLARWIGRFYWGRWQWSRSC